MEITEFQKETLEGARKRGLIGEAYFNPEDGSVNYIPFIGIDAQGWPWGYTTKVTQDGNVYSGGHNRTGLYAALLNGWEKI